VRVSYADELRTILVMGSDGSYAEDSQPLARMSVFCIAKSQSAGSARGSAGGGGRVALDYFQGDASPEHFAKEAARQAIIQLDARDAPAGEMEVVLVRVGQEFCCTKRSDMVLKRLQSQEDIGVFGNDRPPCSQRQVYGRRQRHDAGRRGSLNVDDEGNPTENTVLIEKGILKVIYPTSCRRD